MQLEVPRHKHAGNLQFADQRMHVLPARHAPADTAAPPPRNPRAAQTAPIIISLMRGKSSPAITSKLAWRCHTPVRRGRRSGTDSAASRGRPGRAPPPAAPTARGIAARPPVACSPDKRPVKGAFGCTSVFRGAQHSRRLAASGTHASPSHLGTRRGRPRTTTGAASGQTKLSWPTFENLGSLERSCGG